MNVYLRLAAVVLIVHLLWILWVIFGAVLTRGRTVLTWAHILSLIYSIVIEVGPWPCPLTLAEIWLQAKGGVTPYRESFLIHYLELLIYPDVPGALVAGAACAVCLFNLGVYWVRFRRP